MSVRSTGRYRPDRAWLLAFSYFAVCWTAAWVTGALGRLAAPTPEGIGWWAWFVVSVVVVVVGYWVVWPMGTEARGRPRTPMSWVFGLVWGVSEGLLFLAVQTVVVGWALPVWATVFVTFLVLAGFVGMWHALYWDVEVAPPHNIGAWNLRKVLWVHVPNLAVTLGFLTVYDEAALFVGLQTLALVGSAVAMRFPAPGGAEELVS
jgi:hypothetical protein